MKYCCCGSDFYTVAKRAVWQGKYFMFFHLLNHRSCTQTNVSPICDVRLMLVKSHLTGLASFIRSIDVSD